MTKGKKDGLRLFIVGNFFGNQKGMPTTQAEETKKILKHRGVKVYFASKKINRLPRLLDTLW